MAATAGRTARSVAPSTAPSPRRAERPALRVIDRRTARRRRSAVFMSLAIGVVFLALLASAVFHALLAQGQQQLDHLDQQINQAEQRYDHLRLQVDLLSAPARIVSEASRLGMITPNQVQLVTPPPGAASEITGGAPSGMNSDQNSSDTTTGYQAVKPNLAEQP